MTFVSLSVFNKTLCFSASLGGEQSQFDLGDKVHAVYFGWWSEGMVKSFLEPP